MMTPTLDVNRVLYHPRFRTALSLFRRAYTIDEYGRSQVTETETTIGGVVLPAKQEDLERLPEGDRDRGYIKLLSETPLLLGDDGHSPDEVEWNGRRWVVKTVDPWMYGRGFYSALLEAKAGEPPTNESEGGDDNG